VEREMFDLILCLELGIIWLLSALSLNNQHTSSGIQ
jgi:hypothetical protein